MKRTFTDYSKQEVKEVHAFSSEYNGKKDDHSKVLLELVRKHADEIEELYRKKDQHFFIEVGDLIVLCLELLEEAGKDPDVIMDKCYTRYKNKLKVLLSEVSE